jgi:hypothetical protein
VNRNGVSFEIAGQGRLKSSVFRTKSEKDADKWLLSFPVSGSVIQRGKRGDVEEQTETSPKVQHRSRNWPEEELEGSASKGEQEEKDVKDSDKKATPPPFSRGGLSTLLDV